MLPRNDSNLVGADDHIGPHRITKRMSVLMLAILVLLSCTMTVFAAEGNVTYSGDAGKFIFAPGSDYSLTDLFPNFKDVMPGDILTQTITIKNDASKKVKIKVYMRALGAQEGSEEFLSQLRLLVAKSENNTMSYMFDAAADQTAQLTDWVLLGTLYSGGEIDLDVILDVPVTLDNQFKQQVGYLDWEFRIEEYAVEPTDPEPPKTGDETQLALMFGLMGASAVGIFLLLLLMKRKREEEEAQHDKQI